MRPLAQEWTPEALGRYFFLSTADVVQIRRCRGSHNRIQVKDTNGAPIANVFVSVYHAGRQYYAANGGEQCLFYGEVYDAPPARALHEHAAEYHCAIY